MNKTDVPHSVTGYISSRAALLSWVKSHKIGVFKIEIYVKYVFVCNYTADVLFV